MHKYFLMSVLGLGLGIGSMQAADVVVRVGPPRAIVEHRIARALARGMFGLRNIIAGTAMPMSGNTVAGSFRPANMRYG